MFSRLHPPTHNVNHFNIHRLFHRLDFIEPDTSSGSLSKGSYVMFVKLYIINKNLFLSSSVHLYLLPIFTPTIWKKKKGFFNLSFYKLDVQIMKKKNIWKLCCCLWKKISLYMDHPNIYIYRYIKSYHINTGSCITYYVDIIFILFILNWTQNKHINNLKTVLL